MIFLRFRIWLHVKKFHHVALFRPFGGRDHFFCYTCRKRWYIR